MYDKDSKGMSYTAGFFMLIAFTIAGTVAAAIVSGPVWTAMTNTSITKMIELSADPAYRNPVRVVQAITSIIGFLLPALITASILNRRPMKLLGLSQSINYKQVGLAFAVMIAGLFVSQFFSYVNDQIPISQSLKQTFDGWEAEYNKQAAAVLGLENIGDLFIALFLMAFLPALCEEVLFRGGLQNFLTRGTGKPWLSIIIVSVLFSAMHLSFYGFLPRLFLGIVLGLLFEYSGRLWLNVIAHFTNNALAVVAVYVATRNGKSLETVLGENSGTWVGVFALPVVIVLLVVFRRVAGKPAEIPEHGGKNEELRNTPFY